MRWGTPVPEALFSPFTQSVGNPPLLHSPPYIRPSAHTPPPHSPPPPPRRPAPQHPLLRALAHLGRPSCSGAAVQACGCSAPQRRTGQWPATAQRVPRCSAPPRPPGGSGLQASPSLCRNAHRREAALVLKELFCAPVPWEAPPTPPHPMTEWGCRARQEGPQQALLGGLHRC